MRAWLVCLALAACCSAAAPLAVTLVQGEGGLLRVRVTNTGRAPVEVALDCALGDTHLGSAHLLSVTGPDGRPVRYVGRVAKRGCARPQQWLAAGETWSAQIQVEDSYEMAEGAVYSVGLGWHGLEAVRATDQKRPPPQARFVAGPRPARRQALFEPCTDPAFGDLRATAALAAAGIAAARDTFLVEHGCSTGDDYVEFLGAPTRARLAHVAAALANISSLLLETEPGRNLSFDCSMLDCGSTWFAYVYPSDTTLHTVFLCAAYAAAPQALSYDSRPGTLVHEVSHFADVAATADFVYGRSACRTLAKAAPDSAVHNADSYEYFVESAPDPAGAACDQCHQATDAAACNATGAPCGWCSETDRCASGAGDGGPVSPFVANCTAWLASTGTPSAAARDGGVAGALVAALLMWVPLLAAARV